MIAALVNAGLLFDQPSWIKLAQRAFDFIARAMTRGDRLGHSWREGKLKFPGLASDFAAMIRAALALYEATGRRVPLKDTKSRRKSQIACKCRGFFGLNRYSRLPASPSAASIRAA